VKPGEVSNTRNSLGGVVGFFCNIVTARCLKSNVSIGLAHRLAITIVSLCYLRFAFCFFCGFNGWWTSSDSDDIKDVDLTSVHNLSGPVAVEGAEPGDCLVVDILDGMDS
jgi:hypothetical protein